MALAGSMGTKEPETVEMALAVAGFTRWEEAVLEMEKCSLHSFYRRADLQSGTESLRGWPAQFPFRGRERRTTLWQFFILPVMLEEENVEEWRMEQIVANTSGRIRFVVLKFEEMWMMLLELKMMDVG